VRPVGTTKKAMARIARATTIESRSSRQAAQTLTPTRMATRKPVADGGGRKPADGLAGEEEDDRARRDQAPDRERAQLGRQREGGLRDSAAACGFASSWLAAGAAAASTSGGTDTSPGSVALARVQATAATATSTSTVTAMAIATWVENGPTLKYGWAAPLS